MARLVDACSFADDHAHPDHWRGLATVYSSLQHQSFFSTADHLLDHSWNTPPHPVALAPAGSLAWRAASRRRCGDDFAAGLFHRPAGKLFHLALSARDYRREYLVLAAHRVSNGRDLSSSPCRNDRAGILGENPAHLLQPADCGEPSHLARHESPWVSCGGLSGELVGPVSS